MVVTLYLDFNIYALGLSILANVLMSTVNLLYYFRKTIYQLLYISKHNCYDWWPEFSALIWRYGISWSSGYFIFQIFTPIAFYFHGAVFSWHGRAFMFTAKSGTGKSTQLKNWLQLYGDEINIINGDKPILAIRDDQVLVYPSPWKGKEGWGQDDVMLPLAGIIFLEQDRINEIRKMNIRERF